MNPSMMNLTDKVKSLAVDPDDPNGSVSLAAVLKLVENAVAVEVDPTIHRRLPAENERESWAALDTAWNLLREVAVKLVIMSMREQAAEQGVPFPATDLEMFEEGVADDPENAPRTYSDLAAESPLAATGLHAVLSTLVDETMTMAAAAINDES